MKERINYVILIIALISLILSIIALVYNLKEDSDKTEEVFGNCRLLSGSIPDSDVSTCDERCQLYGECVFGILTLVDQKSFIECQAPLNNDYYQSYQCLCC